MKTRGLAIALAFLVVVAGAALVLWYRLAPLTPRKLRAEIATSLPPGSSSDKVIEFLAEKGVGYEGPIVTEGFTGYPQGRWAYVMAAVRDHRKGNPFAEGVFLSFRFDSSSKLLDWRVEYSYTF